jgi:hypothetical protein
VIKVGNGDEVSEMETLGSLQAKAIHQVLLLLTVKAVPVFAKLLAIDFAIESF